MKTSAQYVLWSRIPRRGESATRLPDLPQYGIELRRRGNAVERHIDKSSHATRRCGHGGSLKPFPLGTAGFVDVDVRVHNTGHHDRVSKIDHIRRDQLLRIAELGNDSV